MTPRMKIRRRSSSPFSEIHFVFTAIAAKQTSGARLWRNGGITRRSDRGIGGSLPPTSRVMQNADLSA